MTDQEIVDLLTVTGHMEYPHGKSRELRGVSGFGVVSPLPLGHEYVGPAIASYQEFNTECLDPLCLKHHSRPLRCDGEPGPATHELWSQPRCKCPDYPLDVQAATGSGNWKGCHNFPNFHAAKAYIDTSRMPGFLDDDFEEIWSNTVNAYDAIGLRWIRTDDKSEANTVISWERGRGWIGLAIVGQNQSCQSSIWARFDTGYNPSNTVRMWSGLFMHELGHNAGLQHTRGGIMSSYLQSLPASWENDPSRPILARKFGGKPIGGEDLDQYFTHQILWSPSGREVKTALNPPILIGEDD